MREALLRNVIEDTDERVVLYLRQLPDDWHVLGM